MWEPRRLTTVWASMACYRDSFTFYLYLKTFKPREVTRKHMKGHPVSTDPWRNSKDLSSAIRWTSSLVYTAAGSWNQINSKLQASSGRGRGWSTHRYRRSTFPSTCIKQLDGFWCVLQYNYLQHDHRGRVVQGMKYRRPLKHWDRAFESHSTHGYLSSFLLCLCCPV
jgi:hypothetical protein